jgi:hypothetical protein
MRSDSVGLFWIDEVKVKAAPKEVVKCIPPERTWERPDYLPGLEAAKAFAPDLFTDYELGQAALAGERLVWDIECYPNYFCVAFKSVTSGKVIDFELSDDFDWYMDLPKLWWIMHNFCLIDFNGNHYDIPIMSLALTGRSTQHLFNATERIITFEIAAWQVLKSYKTKRLEINHIDLFDVPPVSGSLKTYAGRLHCKRMQDLPFKPGTILSREQAIIVRWYCSNDLDNTILLYNHLTEQLALREQLMHTYGTDLRSRSDPQIAEDIIKEEIYRATGERVYKPRIEAGTTFRYNPPAYLNFSTEAARAVLETIKNADLVVNEFGKVDTPPEFKKLNIKIGSSTYQLGRGGLHSNEKRAAHVTDETYLLIDRDVASFYPRIILSLGLFPKHLGQIFLQIYNKIVDQRLHAKAQGWKAIQESLKIVINGLFGKLGSPYSIVYGPDLLMTVTLTGQLALLLLIESLELHGISVVSANTDGIVIKCRRDMVHIMDAVIAEWEQQTHFVTEATYYKSIYCRDVNDYIAIKDNGEIKVKGVYSERGSNGNSVLSKNPTTLICADAVALMLSKQIPLEETIRNSKNFTRFLTVRSVTDGAVKDGVYLGKVIRWYYAEEQEGTIIYAGTGKKVPRSEGAKPCMNLPDSFPEDINYQWYLDEANKILSEIGYQ